MFRIWNLEESIGEEIREEEISKDLSENVRRGEAREEKTKIVFGIVDVQLRRKHRRFSRGRRKETEKDIS